jgi:hypothetical protein
MSREGDERNARWEIEKYLAYALKNGNCVLEKPDMKDRNDELDIGIVTDTVHCVEPTCLTEGILLRRTLKAHGSRR